MDGPTSVICPIYLTDGPSNFCHLSCLLDGLSYFCHLSCILDGWTNFCHLSYLLNGWSNFCHLSCLLDGLTYFCHPSWLLDRWTNIDCLPWFTATGCSKVSADFHIKHKNETCQRNIFDHKCRLSRSRLPGSPAKQTLTHNSGSTERM